MPTSQFLMFMQIHGVCEIRFCSVEVQPKPQCASSVNSGQAKWVGQALVFMRLGVKPGNKVIAGYTPLKWSNICTEVGWVPVDLNEMTKKSLELFRCGPVELWKSYIRTLDHTDNRCIELHENVLKLSIPEQVGSGHMSPRTSTVIGQSQIAKMTSDVAKAVAACDRIEEESKAAEGRLEHLSKGEMQKMRARSYKAVTNLMAAKEEVRDTVYFEDQPHGKRKRSKLSQHSLKCKRPSSQQLSSDLRQARSEASMRCAASSSQLCSLTIQEKVIGRQLPQAAGEEWKYKVAAFLSRRDLPNGESMQLLRDLLPEKVHFFLGKNARNFPGFLLPCKEVEKAPNWPSTLDIHRCAAGLEAIARTLLQRVRDAADGVSCARLRPDKACDLQLFFMFAGGLQGSGPRFWPAECCEGLPFLPEANLDGEFYDSLVELRRLRAAAFGRQYFLAHEADWALPYIFKGYLLKDSIEKSVNQDRYVANLRDSFHKLTEFRTCAVYLDRKELVVYGSKMVQYLKRLLDLAAVVGGGCSKISEFASKAELLFSAETKMHRDLPAVSKPGYVKDMAVIDCRKRQEAHEAGMVMRDLNLTSSPLLSLVAAVRKKLVAAMASDVPLTATACLHSSPFLPSARYDPGILAAGLD